jgi:hypothetical protein
MQPLVLVRGRSRTVLPTAIVPVLDEDDEDDAPAPTRKEVRSVPAEPQETTIGHRPGVVRVPTVHVQLTRPFDGRFRVKPAA